MKERQNLVNQYVNLRNKYVHLLLTSFVNVENTIEWLNKANIEIKGLIEDNILLGVGILYFDREGEITIFVKESNKGVGSRLLSIIQEIAAKRGLNSIWAWVLEENVPAQRMFEKNGFKKEGITVRNYKGILRKGIRFVKKLEEREMNSKIEHTQEVYSIRPEAKEFPIMSVISFVYVCNAKCPHCPYTNSQIRADYKDKPFMDEDTFKIIADQSGAYSAWIRISGGGEPMLHPKAVELMEYAKKQRAKIGLITNGSRFNEENSRRLLEAQVDMIEFSVDAGDAETYAIVREGLDWDTLVRNVEKMVELRNRLKSSTKIIASGVNQKEVDIEKVSKFWEPKVDYFQKRKYLTWGINDPNKSADPTPYLPPEEMIPCPFIFERLNIDSRGKVMVCGFDIAAVTNMGNVHEKSIKEIWHSDGFEYYRQKHLEKKAYEISLCKNCPDWKYRSWKYNYWKIVKKAEERHKEKLMLDIQETEGYMIDIESNL